MKRAVMMSLAAAMIALSVTPAEAQSRRPYPGWQDDAEDRYEDAKNRRKARRAGVAAAIVVSGVTKSVRKNEVEERYKECIRFDYYDIDCDRQRYRDLEKSRTQARRSALVAGIVTREIVRD